MYGEIEIKYSLIGSQLEMVVGELCIFSNFIFNGFKESIPLMLQFENHVQSCFCFTETSNISTG